MSSIAQAALMPLIQSGLVAFPPRRPGRLALRSRLSSANAVVAAACQAALPLLVCGAV
jgi:hypothetical protein